MRFTSALFAVGAAAAATSGSDLGSYKLMSIATGCKFGRCFTSYVVSGEEAVVDGVTYPAFAARCKTMGGCTNALKGSEISSVANTETGLLTITQTVGKSVRKATTEWDESSEVYLDLPVISVS
ncbi:hypothetical protein F4808DRAFT_405249 [Astrocystis sublimbata]|nr:hypothetical protein F4808DRAFT_405249 [Astrocystis sublimbata]